MEGIPLDKLPESHRKLAEVIGAEATLALCKEYGGTPLYIPKVDALLAAQRDQQIRSEFNGMNTVALARQFKLSVRTIQSIVEGSPPAQLEGQMNIEDYL